MSNFKDDPAHKKQDDIEKKNVNHDDPKKEKDNDKFSPGEPDDYNAEEFSTD